MREQGNERFTPQLWRRHGSRAVRLVLHTAIAGRPAYKNTNDTILYNEPVSSASVVPSANNRAIIHDFIPYGGFLASTFCCVYCVLYVLVPLQSFHHWFI